MDRLNQFKCGRGIKMFEEIISKIFLKRTGIDFKSNEEYKELNLFGKVLNINPREMVMVYMDLKNQFKIDNLNIYLENKEFITCKKICEIIEKLAAKKEVILC